MQTSRVLRCLRHFIGRCEIRAFFFFQSRLNLKRYSLRHVWIHWRNYHGRPSQLFTWRTVKHMLWRYIPYLPPFQLTHGCAAVWDASWSCGVVEKWELPSIRTYKFLFRFLIVGCFVSAAIKLLITVRDGGDPSLTSSAVLTVFVIDNIQMRQSNYGNTFLSQPLGGVSLAALVAGLAGSLVLVALMIVATVVARRNRKYGHARRSHSSSREHVTTTVVAEPQWSRDPRMTSPSDPASSSLQRCAVLAIDDLLEESDDVINGELVIMVNYMLICQCVISSVVILCPFLSAFISNSSWNDLIPLQQSTWGFRSDG